MAVERQHYFLVERYLPSIANQRVELAMGRLEALARAGVRHLMTLVIAGEETCLSVFEAPDAAAVRDLNERASFDLDRIVEVELVGGVPDTETFGGGVVASKAVIDREVIGATDAARSDPQ
jgi:hypothetical protein